MTPLAERRLAALLAYIGGPNAFHTMLEAPVELDAHAAKLDEKDETFDKGWRRGGYLRLARALAGILDAPASSPKAIVAKIEQWHGPPRKPCKVIDFATAAARVREQKEAL